ncbi:unnamed protein product [Paramecium primaurelia]|uniref:Opine dehydrogenase domain-containing protein n=1 Tax=Paramecium primaurelia TaxID=5886 RepID=A0A8S1LDQ7_PARPR|nr:unnamed protein product [Paramecium primaurelia]
MIPTSIVVCGGGNGSHATVASAGRFENIQVNVFTRKPQDWKQEIVGLTKGSPWESLGNFVGKINKVSNNPQDFVGAKLWIIGGPAHVHHEILQKIAPFVTKDSFVGTLYAQGGFEWMCRSVFGDRIRTDNITYFGLYNIPWLCKIFKYGESVRIIGPKTKLQCALSNLNRKEELFLLLENMFQIPVLQAPNFLTLTLTPSNQIIHPARVYAVFRNWDGKQVFQPSEVPTFYEDFDDFSAYMLQILDDEIQAIKREILKRYPHFNLDLIIPIKERIIQQYGDQVKDKSNLKTVFRTNAGYATIQIPTKPVQGGVQLNTEARIFWEDIPYGLCILKDLSEMLGLQTPGTDKMIEWHQKFMNKEYIQNSRLNRSLLKETGAPTKYGLDTIEKVLGIQEVSQQIPKL